jgi:hypothetical protein
MGEFCGKTDADSGIVDYINRHQFLGEKNKALCF